MKLKFKLGILFKLAIWHTGDLEEDLESFYFEMDDDAKMLGVKPKGKAKYAMFTIYSDRDFCTTRQLEYLIKKLKRKTKNL